MVDQSKYYSGDIEEVYVDLSTATSKFLFTTKNNENKTIENNVEINIFSTVQKFFVQLFVNFDFLDLPKSCDKSAEWWTICCCCTIYITKIEFNTKFTKYLTNDYNKIVTFCVYIFVNINTIGSVLTFAVPLALLIILVTADEDTFSQETPTALWIVAGILFFGGILYFLYNIRSVLWAVLCAPPGPPATHPWQQKPTVTMLHN